MISWNPLKYLALMVAGLVYMAQYYLSFKRNN